MGVQEDAGLSVRNGRVGSQGGSPRRSRSSRTRRRLVIAGVLAVFVLLVIWAALDLRAAYAELRAAEGAAGQAQSRLLAGDLEAAGESFGDAAVSFAEAERALSRPVPRLLRVVPLVGRNLAVVDALAVSGRDVAEAGTTALSAINELPGGAAALSPSDGRLPIEHIAVLAPALADAEERVGQAVRRVADAPSSFLLRPVGQARVDFARRLSQIRQPVRSGAVLSAALPDFLGAGGPRQYFFGASNPAELRGTGGLIGAWTVLTVDDGRLEFGDFTTIGTLTARDARDVEGPDRDFEARYRRFAAAGHGSNINMTPDFPSAARAIDNLHWRERGERLDGVMVADPYVFEALLALTGPVDVPDVRRLDAEGVVDFVTNEQWAEFGDDIERKPVLGSVAEVTLGRFLAGGSDPVGSLQALASAAGDGHLLMYSADVDEQAAFVEAGVAGSFTDDTDGALFSVITNNAGANKLDYYLEHELDYEMWLDESGAAFGRASVRMTNTAPTSGRDQTVLGPNVDYLQAGENLLYTSTYCAPGCALLRHTTDGQPSPIGPEREFGMAVFPTSVQLASGQSSELGFEWRQDQAWDGHTFRLIVPSQPLMRPARLRVRVHAPADRPLSPGLVAGARVDGTTITWEGELSRRTVLTFPRQQALTEATGFLHRLDQPLLGG